MSTKKLIYATIPRSDGRRVITAKVYRDARWGSVELIVRLYRDGVLYEPADYFSEDQDDAIDTAHAMVLE